MGALEAAPVVFDLAEDVPQGGACYWLCRSCWRRWRWRAISEVRTLREKLKLLCAETGRAARWNAALAREWISQHEPKPHGLAFCVDGRVRVYHGELTSVKGIHTCATQPFWQPAPE